VESHNLFTAKQQLFEPRNSVSDQRGKWGVPADSILFKKHGEDVYIIKVPDMFRLYKKNISLVCLRRQQETAAKTHMEEIRFRIPLREASRNSVLL